MRFNELDNDTLSEDIGTIPPLADLIVMAVVAQTTVSVIKAAFKAATTTGKGLLKLKSIADRAGVKLDRAVMGESNPFTDARMNAIKDGKEEFTVNGKTYKVTGDTTDEEQAVANEAINKDEFAARLADKQKAAFYKAALDALHRLVTNDPRGQTVGGYAFDIARSFNGLNAKELESMYNANQ